MDLVFESDLGCVGFYCDELREIMVTRSAYGAGLSKFEVKRLKAKGILLRVQVQHGSLYYVTDYGKQLLREID